MAENEGDAEQRTLFSIRSDLAVIKEGPAALKVETVLDEIAKLKQLRELGLPEELFLEVPAKLVTQYRQRAGTEWPRELRRHPLPVRYTLLAALCWQREQEITDDLIQLLIHIAHHVEGQCRADEIREKGNGEDYIPTANSTKPGGGATTKTPWGELTMTSGSRAVGESEGSLPVATAILTQTAASLSKCWNTR